MPTKPLLLGSHDTFPPVVRKLVYLNRKALHAGERSTVIRQDTDSVSLTAKFAREMLGDATFWESVKHCIVVTWEGWLPHVNHESFKHFLSHCMFSLLLTQFVQLHRQSSSCWGKKNGYTTSHSSDFRLDTHKHTQNSSIIVQIICDCMFTVCQIPVSHNM